MPDIVHPNDFERSDAPPGLIVALAAGLAAVVIGLMVGLALLFPQALADRPKGPIAALPPQPRLQVAPEHDRARHDAAEKPRREAIERAMRDVAAHGWRQ